VLACLVGCEASPGESCDDETSTCEDSDTSFLVPVDTAPEMTEPLGPMYLVRIDDVAPQSFDCYHCGADIDAVMVVTASGDVVYPTDLVALEFRNAPITGWDICWRSILDPPDAFPDYPDTSRCVLEDELYGCLPFIPLGGDGAFVIYEMEVPISPGDTVVVLEVGRSR